LIVKSAALMALWRAIAMIRPRAHLTSLTLRQCREALGLSQAIFAAQLVRAELCSSGS